MRPTAHLAARIDAILATLRSATDAARATLRIDLPERGIHVDDVAAEAVRPGVRSLRGQTSIDQRAAGSIRWIDANRRPLVQHDLSGRVEPAPPPQLMSVFGVTAQMLGPVVRGDALTGWISVHDDKGPRRWTDADVAALDAAVRAVQRELDGADAQRTGPLQVRSLSSPAGTPAKGRENS